MVAKLIANVAILAVTIGLTILVMIQGWGLYPKNWYWVIAVSVIGRTVLQSLAEAVNKKPA